jgi:hypothetical protein
MDASFLASVDGLPTNELRAGVNGELDGRTLSKNSLVFQTNRQIGFIVSLLEIFQNHHE